MTTKRGIFGGERKGIDLNGGRKANILASMARKAQQSLMNIEKSEVTPFSGHSLSSSGATSLATSQVSEGQNGLFDGELLRQIAREQAQKLMKQYMMSRDKSLTEGINTLNRNIDTVQKHFHAALEAKAMQIRNDIEQIQQQHEQNTNNGLKKLVELINRRINDLEKLSLKTNFADEMFQQIETLHERLDGLEQQSPLNTSLVKRETQSLVSKEIEVNFTKSMREVEALKKMVQTMNDERQKVNSEVTELNKTIGDLTSKYERSESKVEQLSRRPRDDQLQKQLQRLRQQLDENTSRINKGLQRLESVELHRVASSQSKELQLTRNNHSGTIEMSIAPSMTNTINEQTVTSVIMGSRQPPELTLQNPIDATSQIIETQLLSRNSQPTEQEPLRQIYQLDKEGYLQDQTGQYILDQQNKFIVLSSEQIQALRTSKMLLE